MKNTSSENDDTDSFNEINITPFVDVVLVLLVIFMITAPVMMKESLKVQLPKTLTSESQSKSTTIGVAVTKEGQFIFKGKVLTKSELENQLIEIEKIDNKTNFLISADTDSRHGDVVSVIDLLKKNNLNYFALQVERIKGN
jgi:biopolymer transport protein ExbD